MTKRKTNRSGSKPQSVHRYGALAIATIVLCAFWSVPAYPLVANSLCHGVSVATEGLGKSLASAAVIALGVGAVKGRVSNGTAITVGGGILALFGFLPLVSAFGATSC